MAILFVQVTSEGIVKLLEGVTSVHCRTISIRLQDCPGSGSFGRGLHHRHCIALELSHSARPWHRCNQAIECLPRRTGCLEEVAKGRLRLTSGRVGPVGPVGKCSRVLIEGDGHSDGRRCVFAVQDNAGIAQMEGVRLGPMLLNPPVSGACFISQGAWVSLS